MDHESFCTDRPDDDGEHMLFGKQIILVFYESVMNSWYSLHFHKKQDLQEQPGLFGFFFFFKLLFLFFGYTAGQ